MEDREKELKKLAGEVATEVIRELGSGRKTNAVEHERHHQIIGAFLTPERMEKIDKCLTLYEPVKKMLDTWGKMLSQFLFIVILAIILFIMTKVSFPGFLSLK